MLTISFLVLIFSDFVIIILYLGFECLPLFNITWVAYDQESFYIVSVLEHVLLDDVEHDLLRNKFSKNAKNG